MNKKFLIMSVFTLVIMILPLIPMAQAKKGEIPTEMYRDLMVVGGIKPITLPTDIWERGNIQSASYTAQSFAGQWITMLPPFLFPGVSAGDQFIGFVWNSWTESLMGTATYEVEYTINTETLKGVVYLKTTVKIDSDDAFLGDMFWVGDLILNPDNTVSISQVEGSGNMWHTNWQGIGDYDGWKIIQNMNTNPSWAAVGTGMAGDCHLIKPVDE